MFSQYYENICLRGKSRKYGIDDEGNSLHRHHIKPSHSGGSNDEENLTNLTIREHIIAHYLLWKIHRNPNDLRSMYMLGARLTKSQRKITGEFCRDNNIGFFAADKESRSQWGKKGALRQIADHKGIHTKNQELRSSWASMGGKIGAIHQIERGLGIHTKNQELRSSWASMGGKIHSGKKWLNDGSKNYRIPEEKIEQWLKIPNMKIGLLTKKKRSE